METKKGKLRVILIDSVNSQNNIQQNIILSNTRNIRDLLVILEIWNYVTQP